MKRAVLILGGGGVKGLVHVGAWRALQDAGVKVVEFVGTSIGSLVAACIAGGAGWGELVSRSLGLRRRDIVALNFGAFLINGIREPSVFRATALQDFIGSALPVTRFDQLGTPAVMNAVDLETGQMEWFGEGHLADVPLADAVYASCALPVFYPPALINGRYYVDGGVLDSLPLRRGAASAAARGADLVIAVDASSGRTKDPLDTMAKGLVAVHHRVFDIMADELRQHSLASWSGPPLIHIRPRLSGYSTFDLHATQYFLEEGYRAARRALMKAGLIPSKADSPAAAAVRSPEPATSPVASAAQPEAAEGEGQPRSL
jgi:NTE family protein